MKKSILTTALLVITGLVFSQTGSITNIQPAQRTDGSMIVDVSYDLSGTEPDYTVGIEISFDGGTTFLPADSVTGDLGDGIQPGAGKSIVWKFGAEYPGQFSNQMIVKLTATHISTFACGDLLVDTRDNQVYSTVRVSSYCWMADNLNIGTRINGASSQTNNGIIEKYCFNNSEDYCNEYGGMYQWNEMMEYVTTPGVQGICPEGWHLPADDEWTILERNLDSLITFNSTGWRGVVAGGKLKEQGTVHWFSPNTGATNSSGFTALPGGERHSSNGTFNFMGTNGYWWTSSELGVDAYYRTLGYNTAQSSRSNRNKNYGYSVRCVADTILPWSCGEALPGLHVAGDVAPVDKDVFYSSTISDLTGSEKCWLTQNLGSDRQALSADDATELSAGWYWQFNRKQGFKHDGTTRTPNTTWINYIYENTDWQTANDPCTILLGTGWRVPTRTEWENADQNGGWENYYDTFSSDLKLHAAGRLESGDGSLYLRGITGNYWSSTQHPFFDDGLIFYTDKWDAHTGSGSKAYGFSIRCLKD